MRLPFRLKLQVTIAVVIAGVALIGWVARSTRAQDRAPKELAPATPTPELPQAAPVPAPLELPPHPREEVAPPSPATKPEAPPSIGIPAPSPAGPENDDPEKNARAFVEQNRKVAQDELKKLKDEAERLRARLGKVEGGIRRWEALLAALEDSERTAKPAFKPASDAPTELDPVPVSSRGAKAVREAVPASTPPVAPR